LTDKKAITENKSVNSSASSCFRGFLEKNI